MASIAAAAQLRFLPAFGRYLPLCSQTHISHVRNARTWSRLNLRMQVRDSTHRCWSAGTSTWPLPCSTSPARAEKPLVRMNVYGWASACICWFVSVQRIGTTVPAVLGALAEFWPRMVASLDALSASIEPLAFFDSVFASNDVTEVGRRDVCASAFLLRVSSHSFLLTPPCLSPRPGSATVPTCPE